MGDERVRLDCNCAVNGVQKFDNNNNTNKKEEEKKKRENMKGNLKGFDFILLSQSDKAIFLSCKEQDFSP